MSTGVEHSGARATIYPYLLDKLAIDRPNQVWSSDLTYLPMAHGFMVLDGDSGCSESQSIGLAAVEAA